jgi:hypothetical protein
MIGLLRLLLPYLLTLLFFYQGTRKPLFFLGIPFLMFMDTSVFFDSAKLFHVPGSLDYALQFIWLISLWILSKMIPSAEQPRLFNKASKFNLVDYCVSGLIIIVFVGFINTFFKYFSTREITQEFISEISLFAGYFIMRNWFAKNTEETLVSFLLAIVIVNSIASLLFIIHQGLHLEIYISEKDPLAELINGQDITRNFWFAPAFASFSVVFLLIFWKKKPVYFIPLLIINLLGVFITYTRSLLATAILIFLLYFILTALKKGRLVSAVKNIFVFSVAGLLGVFILSKLLPNNTKYFKDRFEELSKKTTPDEQNNLEYRMSHTGSVISQIDESHVALGMGPVTEKQMPLVEDMKAATADMVWTGVIYRWGYAGLILFAIIYMYSLFASFKLFWNDQGILSDLALLLFIFIITQIIESFFSWTFLSGHGVTIGLWYFALLNALSSFDKRANSALNTIVINNGAIP